jgi:hypothetical protein
VSIVIVDLSSKAVAANGKILGPSAIRREGSLDSVAYVAARGNGPE